MHITLRRVEVFSCAWRGGGGGKVFCCVLERLTLLCSGELVKFLLIVADQIFMTSPGILIDYFLQVISLVSIVWRAIHNIPVELRVTHNNPAITRHFQFCTKWLKYLTIESLISILWHVDYTHRNIDNDNDKVFYSTSHNTISNTVIVILYIK